MEIYKVKPCKRRIVLSRFACCPVKNCKAIAYRDKGKWMCGVGHLFDNPILLKDKYFRETGKKFKEKEWKIQGERFE